MINNKELLKQLEAAMARNPGRSLLETIEDAADYVHSSRKIYTFFSSEDEHQNWKLTNGDIYQALVRYNEKG